MAELVLPLIDWTMGIIGGMILFVVFGGLALWLILTIKGSKKQ